MENASNALLMAAGVLISIMIISLGTYLFMTYGSYSKNINDTLSQKQKVEFNNQFTKYDGQEDCSPHDVVTLINLAKNVNEKNKYSENQTLYIEVNVSEETINEKSNTSDLNKFIEKNIYIEGKYTEFKCNVEIDNNSGLVEKIIFKKK